MIEEDLEETLLYIVIMFMLVGSVVVQCRYKMDGWLDLIDKLTYSGFIFVTKISIHGCDNSD